MIYILLWMSDSIANLAWIKQYLNNSILIIKNKPNNTILIKK